MLVLLIGAFAVNVYDFKKILFCDIKNVALKGQILYNSIMDKKEFNSNYSMSRQSPFRIKWFGLFVAMFWAFFAALALSNVVSPYLSQIINGLLTGITPLLIGIIIAFIFHRLVDFTENVILKNAFKNSPFKFGIKRAISITLVMLILVGFIVIIFAILIPKIIAIVQELTTGGGDGWTQMVNNVINEICALIQRWFGAEVDQTSIRNLLKTLFESLKQTIDNIGDLMTISMSVVTGAFNFLMGLLLSILMLKDKEKITKFTRRFVYANFKKERADELCVMARNANKILFDYVICKLIEFSILFVSLGITYSIMGLKFTWENALIIGIFNFIPYFGIYIGSVPAVLLTLIFNSVDSALYMILATVIITTLEFNILIPIITGNKLKVSSLVIASSIIIGGAMFGILGMLFAPPIAAIISVIVTGNIELKENHMRYVMELNASREKQMAEQKHNMELPSDSRFEKTTSSKRVLKSKKQVENSVNATVLISSVEGSEQEKTPKKRSRKVEMGVENSPETQITIDDYVVPEVLTTPKRKKVAKKDADKPLDKEPAQKEVEQKTPNKPKTRAKRATKKESNDDILVNSTVETEKSETVNEDKN